MDIESQMRRLLDQHRVEATSEGVRIPDNEKELNWHAFLGHHDFWRFRGDLFALCGRGDFVPLRRRTPPMGVDYLADVWRELEASNAQRLSGNDLLRRYRWSRTNPTPKENLRRGLENGASRAQQFLRVWQEFRSGTADSYARVLYNSWVLRERFSSSFRTYLSHATADLAATGAVCGSFPKWDWKAEVSAPSGRKLSLEDALAESITKDFALGIEVARYLFCDWLLGLWWDDRSLMFDSYKHDGNAANFGKKYDWYADRRSFLDLCHGHFPDLPPRVINECIWIHQNSGCRCLEETT
jgi:hypothetical protein